MADNSPTTALEELQSRFPHIYDVYNKKTALYALLDIYAKNHEYKLGLIDRLYAALGIEDTYDEDLEWRWGSLLNLYRHPNESYSDYRSRLEIVYPSLVGGTTEAIKYAVATAIGLTSDSDVIDQYIHVYDAWEYSGEIIDDSSSHDTYEPTTNTDLALNDGFKTNLPYNPKKYGAFVVTVDLSISETIADYQKAVTEAVMNTKASGTQPYIIYLYIFYDSTAIKNDGDDVDTANINDMKYESAILAVDDGLLPEILTISYGDVAELLTNDDAISHIKQISDENTNTSIRTDDQTISIDIGLQDNESTSIADDDNLTDNISSSISQIGAINSAVIQSRWNSNCINGSAILNESFITNQREEADVCIDRIHYN